MTEMTREDIIAMAREAGFEQDTDGCIYIADRDGDCNAEIERFATLVAAAEREACAKVCDEFAEAYEIEEEGARQDGADSCAAAIRARKEIK